MYGMSFVYFCDNHLNVVTAWHLDVLIAIFGEFFI